jgi:hypothetical protein
MTHAFCLATATLQGNMMIILIVESNKYDGSLIDRIGHVAVMRLRAAARFDL